MFQLVRDIVKTDAVVKNTLSLNVKKIGAKKVDGVYEISTITPVYSRSFVKACYKKCLVMAKQEKCKSIIFPVFCIGMGSACIDDIMVAMSVFSEFLEMYDMDIYLLVDEKLSPKGYFFEGIDSYVTENFKKFFEPDKKEPEVFEYPDDSFIVCMTRLMKERGCYDICNKANISADIIRQVFENRNKPSRQVAISLAFALKLNLPETLAFLQKLDYKLFSNKYDLTLKYFIEHRIYDVYMINLILFLYDYTQLGGIEKESAENIAESA